MNTLHTRQSPIDVIAEKEHPLPRTTRSTIGPTGIIIVFWSIPALLLQPSLIGDHNGAQSDFFYDYRTPAKALRKNRSVALAAVSGCSNILPCVELSQHLRQQSAVWLAESGRFHIDSLARTIGSLSALSTNAVARLKSKFR